MVHYDAPQKSTPTLPPRCPKCGHHRTEIIGRSDDLKTIFVRCGACGARSELPVVQDELAKAG